MARRKTWYAHTLITLTIIMDILIREATTEDAALIAELTRKSWADKVTVPSKGHHEDARKVAEDLLRGGGFVLLKDNEPAGSVRWRPLDTETGVWEIFRMGILPQYRGERLSEELLEAVIHRALVADICELHLAIHPEQYKLIDLYAGLGFEIAPELDYTRSGPQEASAIVMRRWIRP